MSTEPGTTTSRPASPEVSVRAGRSGQRSTLPDWMLNPPPPRITLGQRVGAALLRLPGAPRLRRSWWAWQERQRLHERYPNSFKIIAFFASWGLAIVLFLAAYALFSLA